MSALMGPKIALARAVGSLSRARGGGGTSAPGKALLRLDAGAIGAIAQRLPRGSVLISATNGKTTTTAFAASILRRAGIALVHNQAGANMAGGIASTLLAAARPRGAIAGELGLFEVDELWLDRLATQLQPRVILLGNLFRDQLDRYGELERIAERWAQALARPPADGAQLVLNADDPMIADLGRGRGRAHEEGHAQQEGVLFPQEGVLFQQEGVLYYGVDDDSLALPTLAHATDAKHCRRCGAPYTFDAIYLGHLGRYHCASCGQSRPAPQVLATEVTLDGVRSARFTLRTPAGSAPVELGLPGLYNVYNALAAAALATAMGVSLQKIVAGLAATKAAFGRAESVSIGDPSHSAQPRELRILLIKNPAGANEVLRTLALQPGKHDLLAVLNDNIADGRDVSWVWDADFELLAERIRQITCSGTRAAELAVRLKYAGLDDERIRVQSDLAVALQAAVADRPTGDGDVAPLYALPTYTAMLALRELLVQRGEAGDRWR